MTVMYKSILSVGGFTLLSRVTGFSPRHDARRRCHGRGRAGRTRSSWRMRLPNHFRAIFGEGAFNSAFVPSYARVLESRGADAARSFSPADPDAARSDAGGLHPGGAGLHAASRGGCSPRASPTSPRSSSSPSTLTRITFPYLLFITMVTLRLGGAQRQRPLRGGGLARPSSSISASSRRCWWRSGFPTRPMRPPGGVAVVGPAAAGPRRRRRGPGGLHAGFPQTLSRQGSAEPSSARSAPPSWARRGCRSPCSPTR